MFSFNDELIGAIQDRIPQKNDQLHFLMNTIAMGKETAYRRLRGDIAFTFTEACIIANKLGISLDNLAKIKRTDKPSFELEISPENPLDYIHFRLKQYETSFNFFLSAENISISSVCNTIPYPFLFPFEHLFKLFTFKVVYQISNRKDIHHLSDFILPEELNEIRISMGKKNDYMPEDTIIFDRNIFSSFLKSIQYFHSLKIVTDNEKEVLKKEFNELLDNFEVMAERGERKGGNKTWIYISNIDFDCNYSFVKTDNFEHAYMDGIYQMDTISSGDPQICHLHKGWIESLKKYSTLISISGEIERRSFFEEQRNIINHI